ncbi:MAG: hypothetical protein ACO3RV_07265 [Luteolibacter sp.]
MNYGTGMIWPLAAEYARRGWAVRRAGWDDTELFGDTDRALRWLVYQNSMFWLLYRQIDSGDKATRVVRSSDFGVEDFFAEDWTVLSPSCFDGTGATGADPYQQGKKRYPRPLDVIPEVDPRNPNSKFGACPLVPLYDSIQRTTPS